MKSDIVYCVDDCSGNGEVTPSAANFFFNLGRMTERNEYMRDLAVLNQALERTERLLKELSVSEGCFSDR